MRNVGDVEDREARVPATCPHLVAEAQRMMQAMAAARPVPRFLEPDRRSVIKLPEPSTSPVHETDGE